jgi:flavin reductase (DIM6/NTAB) family NADH-FMN oxidoreductase RutF
MAETVALVRTTTLTEAPPEPVNPLIDALARLVCSVGVVGWRSEGRSAGALVEAITVLSAFPPRVLFCLPKSAPRHNSLLKADRCSVNLLTEGDLATATAFASDAEQPFDLTAWSTDAPNPPRYLQALAVLYGTIGARMDAGTHSAFVLNLDTAELREGAPLVAFDHRYVGIRSVAGEAP